MVGVAVGVSALGAFAWSQAVSGRDDVDVVLDEPGQYVLPGLVTNPPVDGGALPDVALLDADDQDVRLTSDGRPMVVNLWYSTCPPCARELADFAAVHDELAEQVRFVGVNPLDPADVMARFAGDRGVGYELLRDPAGAFGEQLGVVAYPATIFVAADGTVVGSSGVIDDGGLRERIAELVP